jgi:serine/threonine-protein kinase PknG
VWRTDHAFVSAAFGLARVRLRRAEQGHGDRATAIEVLESVPVTSSHHLAAQVAAVLARTRGEPGDDDLMSAADRLGGLDLDAERACYLAVEVLSAALTCVQSGRSSNGGGERRLLGSALAERDLRLGLERRYRALARLANHIDDRIALVDRANAIRPRTLV